MSDLLSKGESLLLDVLDEWHRMPEYPVLPYASRIGLWAALENVMDISDVIAARAGIDLLLSMQAIQSVAASKRCPVILLKMLIQYLHECRMLASGNQQASDISMRLREKIQTELDETKEFDSLLVPIVLNAGPIVSCANCSSGVSEFELQTLNDLTSGYTTEKQLEVDWYLLDSSYWASELHGFNSSSRDVDSRCFFWINWFSICRGAILGNLKVESDYFSVWNATICDLLEQS